MELASPELQALLALKEFRAQRVPKEFKVSLGQLVLKDPPGFREFLDQLGHKVQLEQQDLLVLKESLVRQDRKALLDPQDRKE